MIKTYYYLLIIILITIIICSGCSNEYGVKANVYSEVPLEKINFYIKYYNEEEKTAQIYNEEKIIPNERDGYYGNDINSIQDPLSIAIKLPKSGYYAIHIVGYPVDVTGEHRYYVATDCFNISDVNYNEDFFLIGLPQNVDNDFDTVPDNFDDYCNLRKNKNSDCEIDCNNPEFLAGYDCDPSTNEIHPFINESCGNSKDDDCWGGDVICTDRDNDQYPGNVDCNDNNPDINPRKEEICGNEIDENCKVDLSGCTNGDLPCDEDGDNYYSTVSSGCGNDCNDNDKNINSGADERCDNNLDDDCDGFYDEGCVSDDQDGDGHIAGEKGGDDCNDCDPGINPGMSENSGKCSDLIDQNCDGNDEQCATGDEDKDWYTEPDDCNEGDPRYYPNASDICGDGEAFNCIIETTCEIDVDGDRYNSNNDCDDSNPDVNSGNTSDNCDNETNNGIDNNCNGIINEVWDEQAINGCIIRGDTYTKITFLDDLENCGQCRHDCSTDGFNGQPLGNVCQNGSCLCGDNICGDEQEDSSWVCCDIGSAPFCADIKNDADNCGTCHNACDENSECVDGECRCRIDDDTFDVCDENSKCCPGTGCILKNDINNCGECGFSCDTGEICSNETCLCESEGRDCFGNQWEACCDNGCINVQSDPNNCGDCGNVCNPEETCSNGDCLVNCGLTSGECPDDQICCLDNYCADLNNDPNNCGDCGNDCGDNAHCNNGTCECDADFDNCDDEWDNGCESNLNNDVLNCGVCENNCGSNASCNQKTCNCNEGFDNCDDEWNNGCEINLMLDSQNCGQCSFSCNNNAHCNNGICECDADFNNCDSSWNNGCECNTCCDGSSCINPAGGRCCESSDCGTDAICNNTNCVCNTGFGNCDNTWNTGCEIDLNTSSSYCGNCSTNCGTNSSCIGGNCVCNTGYSNCDSNSGCECNTCCNGSSCITVSGGKCCVTADCSSNATCNNTDCLCNADWGNCDNNWNNGCESDLRISSTHCGNCSTNCGSNATCSDSSCLCNSGFGNCDTNWSNGCETNVNTSNDNCGSCGNSCKANQTCSNGTCLCNSGYADCNNDQTDGCECNGCCGDGVCVSACGWKASCSGGICVCNTNFVNCDNDWLTGCDCKITTNQCCPDGSCVSQSSTCP